MVSRASEEDVTRNEAGRDGEEEEQQEEEEAVGIFLSPIDQIAIPSPSVTPSVFAGSRDRRRGMLHAGCLSRSAESLAD